MAASGLGSQVLGQLGGSASGAAGQTFGNVFGEVTDKMNNVITGGLWGKWQDKKYQKEADRQIAMQNELSKIAYQYNEMAADAADKRSRSLFEDYQSPEAQRRMMEEANLNPALMYGMGGGQGGGEISAGKQGGGASGSGQAASVAQMQQARAAEEMVHLQAAKQMAEIENIKADTGEKKANASSTMGEAGTVGGSQVAKNLADAGLSKAAQANTEADTALKKFEQSINDLTQADQVESLKNAVILSRNAVDVSREELRGAKMDNDVKSANMQNVVTEQAYRTAQAVALYYKIEAETDAIAETIAQGWAAIANASDANEVQRERIDMDRKISNYLGSIQQRGQDIDQKERHYNTDRISKAIVYGNIAGGLAGGLARGAAGMASGWQQNIPKIGF